MRLFPADPLGGTEPPRGWALTKRSGHGKHNERAQTSTRNTAHNVIHGQSPTSSSQIGGPNDLSGNPYIRGRFHIGIKMSARSWKTILPRSSGAECHIAGCRGSPRPYSRRFAKCPDSRCRLSFSVRRSANVAAWATAGEVLLDPRKAGPLGRGTLREAAKAELLPAWERGSAAEVAEHSASHMTGVRPSDTDEHDTVTP
jgi:hypothetical protein